MAAFLLLAPLLLLGTVAGQAEGETEECLGLENATQGNFSVETSPETYQANQTYVVTIKDDRNHNSSGQILLQAVSPQNASVGTWEDAPSRNCNSVETAILNITENMTRWTSPDSNLSFVEIRVYLSLPDNITELKIFTLNREAETTTLAPTTSPATTSQNSVCRAQSSSLLLAALVLLTGTLLS